MSRSQWILALAKGIRERSTDFRYEMFGNQFVPLPAPAEQLAIVRFLDHANRKIDGFIRAKRKLIGLLNEQKQAIIHRAVTRGLDPNAKLIPSGIPWLGEIPAHWDMPLNRQVFRENIRPHNGKPGKRLRCFLRSANPSTIQKTLVALWDHRISVPGLAKGKPLDVETEVSFRKIVEKFGGSLPGKAPATAPTSAVASESVLALLKGAAH